MSEERDVQIQERIIERASDWYVRHRDEELTPADKERFLEWLSASPQHTSEYLAIARLSGGFKAAISDLGLCEKSLLQEIEASAPPTVARLPVSRKVPSRVRSFSIAASLLLSLGAALAAYFLTAPGYAGLPRSIAVAHGEQRTVQLRDGSVMHVNASSKVRIRYSRAERLIELEQGQALFEVARDATRPFRVRAGVADVVAVGTQFDVYRRPGQDVTVTVVQGKVEVVPDRQRESRVTPEHSDAVQRAYRLSAGEQVRIGGAAAPVRAVAVDARSATAWVRREIIFEGEALGDVADEFNRYVPVPIEIEDASLRDLKVNGVFNAYDVESFIVFLKQYDVAIEQGEDRIRVHRQVIDSRGGTRK